MKKTLIAALSAALLAFSFAGCSKGGASGKKEIRVFNIKVEIDSQLKDFAKAYEAKTGIHVEIESSGGGADNQGILKGYKAVGTACRPVLRRIELKTESYENNISNSYADAGICRLSPIY